MQTKKSTATILQHRKGLERTGKRLCLFASFSSTGRLESSVLYYLNTLKSHGFDIVFVSTSPQFKDADAVQLQGICCEVVWRQNIGYDFYSWKTGLALLEGQVGNYEGVLFTNDSIVGPLYPLEPIFAVMEKEPNSLWGLTDSCELGTRHLQSYFLYCSKHIVGSKFFQRFWDRLDPIDDKMEIVTRYEIGFSDAAAKAGVTLAAIFPVAAVAAKAKMLGEAFPYSKDLEQGSAHNTTLFMWDILLKDFQFPFIKAELFRIDRFQAFAAERWESLAKHALPEGRAAVTHFIEQGCWEMPPRQPTPQMKHHIVHTLSRLGLQRQGRQLVGLFQDFKRRDIDMMLMKIGKILARLPWALTRRAGALLQEPSSRTRFENEALLELDSFLSTQSRLQLPQSVQAKITIVIILYNKCQLTYRCLRSLAALGGEGALSFLIIDNGSSDKTTQLLGRIDGATIVKNHENLGFLKACNQARDLVKTELLLLLNNDTIVYPGTIAAAAENFNPQIFSDANKTGAVGGRIILPSGKLQEAGNIIWNDGNCVSYGRGESPVAGEYMFRRVVDYCSGAFLLTKTEYFRRLGGFDERYLPAYYEETDYCVELQRQGLNVIFDPRVVITHLEFGSAEASSRAVAYMNVNRVKFLDKHKEFLATKAAKPAVGNEKAPMLLARSLRQAGKRILIIDDRVPSPRLGAGYPRANSILHAVLAAGYEVTLVCTEYFGDYWSEVRTDVPLEVEVIALIQTDMLLNFLRERASYYDAVWVSRPQNMRTLVEFGSDLLKNRSYKLVFDSEAIFAERLELEAELYYDGKIDPGAMKKSQEMHNGLQADLVISVCEPDAEKWKKAGAAEVMVVGHDAKLGPTPASFSEREGILYLGSLHGFASPNADGLFWFMREVMPLLKSKYPAMAAVKVYAVGYVDSHLKKRLSRKLPGFELVGAVADLQEYLNLCRIMIVPTRFAAGLPQKVFDAALAGIPTVCSPIIAAQMGWQDGKETLVGSTAIAEEFAAKSAQLYSNEETWKKIQQASGDSMREYAKKHSIHGDMQRVFSWLDKT
jgi:GT2 family glycosyltransferase